MQFLFKNTNLEAEIFDRKYTFSRRNFKWKIRTGPQMAQKIHLMNIPNSQFIFSHMKWAILRFQTITWSEIVENPRNGPFHAYQRAKWATLRFNHVLLKFCTWKLPLFSFWLTTKIFWSILFVKKIQNPASQSGCEYFKNHPDKKYGDFANISKLEN